MSGRATWLAFAPQCAPARRIPAGDAGDQHRHVHRVSCTPVVGIRAILLAVLLVLSSVAYASDVAPVTRISTASGVVQGVIENNLAVFRGIPYAKPPVGDLRWRAPQPVDPWKEVLDARRLSADCMQAPFGPTPTQGRHPVAEDCLYLNIWRPASDARKLPVMVWIHGGGFVNGGSSSPDSTGEGVAARDAVFVSFNYRLGRFGFFALPALSAEHAEEAKGNYGLMDQIAALRWVRNNIDRFGGDANNITVVGESAGGISINMLLTSPSTSGLFDRAIIQSGGGRKLVRTRDLAKDVPDAVSAATLGIKFAKSKGIEGADAAALAKLRELSADAVTSGLNMVGLLVPDRALFSGPVIDGKLFVESPEEAYAAGRQHPVPLIVGATSSDLSLSYAKSVEDAFAIFGADAGTARSAYDPTGDGDLKRINNAIGSDRAMVEPARFIARSMSQLRRVYAFRFSYVLEAKRSGSPYGAQHATDVPYAFDLLSAVHGDIVSPADGRIAAAMCDYWVAFARTGNPNGASRPTWPAYNAAADAILDFSSSGAPIAAPDPWRARLDLMERLNAR
ncbi:carboxylesterase/lipase family protein [Steroidobacter agaridevorans]|uniref:carboxylesterase/lipase family protein n=1 Tax=Steroidobacter agaridevorans TaxID=2695856 RepID=UPI00137ADC03|nr:carboxylesterase family protein [Steroidobacter agaridevorans]